MEDKSRLTIKHHVSQIIDFQIYVYGTKLAMGATNLSNYSSANYTGVLTSRKCQVIRFKFSFEFFTIAANLASLPYL